MIKKASHFQSVVLNEVKYPMGWRLIHRTFYKND